MEFRPASPKVSDDEAVRFTRALTNRTATFNVVEGTTVALADLTVQTGTTAGTIVFRAEVGGWTETATIDIPPERVVVDKVSAVRKGSMLEFEITGYDNTRTVDGLTFTFYTAKGEAVQPGVIRVNGAAEFQRYFEGATAGGVFTLKAVFPVTGGIGEITSCDVILANGSGSTQIGKIHLQ